MTHKSVTTSFRSCILCILTDICQSFPDRMPEKMMHNYASRLIKFGPNTELIVSLVFLWIPDFTLTISLGLPLNARLSAFLPESTVIPPFMTAPPTSFGIRLCLNIPVKHWQLSCIIYRSIANSVFTYSSFERRTYGLLIYYRTHNVAYLRPYGTRLSVG